MRFLYALPLFLCVSTSADSEIFPNPFSTSSAAANAAAPPVQQQPKQEQSATPPDIKPYQIPRFNGKEGEDFRHIPALTSSPT